MNGEDKNNHVRMKYLHKNELQSRCERLPRVQRRSLSSSFIGDKLSPGPTPGGDKNKPNKQAAVPEIRLMLHFGSGTETQSNGEVR